MAIYDTIIQRAQMSEAQIQNQMLDAQLKQQRLSEMQNAKLYSDINTLKETPEIYSDEEKSALIKRATMGGVDMQDAAQAESTDPSFGKQVGAFAGGAFDSLLFGILKDSWYSDDSTKGTATAGKLAGTIAGFLIPGMQGKALASLGSKAGIGGMAKLVGMTGAGKKLLSAAKILEKTGEAPKMAEALSAIANIYRTTGTAKAGIESAKPWAQRKDSPYYIDPTWADMLQLQGMGR